MKYKVTILKIVEHSAQITMTADSEDEIRERLAQYDGGDIENANGFHEIPDWCIENKDYSIEDIEEE